MCYTRFDSNYTHTNPRRPTFIRHIVAKLLEENGAPMTLKELKHGVVKVRGVAESFQIHQTINIVQIDDGLWGLRYRDLDLTG